MGSRKDPTQEIDRVKRPLWTCPAALLALGLACAGVLLCQDAGTIQSWYAAEDAEPSADANSPFWKNIRGVVLENDLLGKPVAGHRGEVRSRWTEKAIYFLYVCPYERTSPNPSPNPAVKNPAVWEWDIAEMMIGSDFVNLENATEFSVSPQGEWMDFHRGIPEERGGGMKWSSHFQTKVRTDSEHKVWYAEMRIPFASIDSRPPKKGNRLRVNFFRAQGADPGRVLLSWRPTGVPDEFGIAKAFGTLVLERD
jgi:hypothetical protein